MRHGVLIFLLSILTATVIADIALRIHGANSANGTEIIANEADGAVRILIDGREAARFDKDGLSLEGRVMAKGGVIAPAIAGQPAPTATTESGAP